MDIKSVSTICFSPTGTTKKIIENITQGMQVDKMEIFDCTIKAKRKNEALVINNDMVILATPVYYGRVPEEVVLFLKTINAQKTPVALVVVYGNRDYEDALLELYNISVEQGFSPVAGGVFIAEHSYSNPSRQIAAGRPDFDDVIKAKAFGQKIMEKLTNVDSLDDIGKINIPGSTPYVEPVSLHMIKQARNEVPFTPETDADRCIQCNLCVGACPTAAIEPDDVSSVDKGQCIICFACIKNCPSQAKEMKEPNFNKAIHQLQIACQERKEPEIYI